jgi:AraC-like DNA-binding protein
MSTASVQPSYVQVTTSNGADDAVSVVRVGDITLRRHTFDHGVHLRTTTTPTGAAYGMIVDTAPIVMFSGTRWFSDDIAYSSHGALDVFSLGPSSFIWVDVDPALVQTGKGAFPAHEPCTLRAKRGQALAALRAICLAAFDAPGQTDADAAPTRDAIVAMLRAALSDAEPAHPTRAAGERQRIVEDAEAYIWERIDEPLQLASIASAVGCGVRKLLYCFNRTYGMGPLHYAKLLRLNAVRFTLEGERTDRTIFDVAADYGFWHLGHFGVDYKELFGETPSETRSRSHAANRARSG